MEVFRRVWEWVLVQEQEQGLVQKHQELVQKQQVLEALMKELIRMMKQVQQHAWF